MDESLTRWLGWAVAVLLMLGALGSFHTGYSALGRVLVQAEELVLRDDSYHEDRKPMAEGSLSGNVTGEPSSGNRNGIPSLRYDGIQVLHEGGQEGSVMQMSGTCSGDALMGIWMMEWAEETAHPPILVDGSALETLEPAQINTNAAYRMFNRISSQGQILGTDYQELR